MKYFWAIVLLCGTVFMYGQPKTSKLALTKAKSQTLIPGNERCGNTLDWHKQKMKNDPEYRARVLKHQKLLEKSRAFKNPDCTNGPLIIPVAVHFNDGLVEEDEQDCVISLVEDQINSLNTEINGMDPQNVVFPNFEDCFGQNTVDIGSACVEFCLAQSEHPVGYNLQEGDLAVTFGQIDFNVQGLPSDPNWAGYLNIFIDDLGGGLLGISDGVPGNFNGTGVLIEICTFGTGAINCPGVQSSASCGGIFNEGNTLVHEVGHYLGLPHIWGNGGCGVDDGIADTPLMSSSYNSYTSCGSDNNCADLPSSCGSSDMYMNYMSYAADGCMYMFTSGQADVIYLTVDNFELFGDTIPDPCKPPGPPISGFGYTSTTICPGECIQFFDNSTNTPNMWNWSFSVVSGDITIDSTSSMLQNPTICVPSGTNGSIEVILNTSNDQGAGIPDTQVVEVTLLDMDNLNCGIACADFDGGPYIDLLYPNICQAGCPIVTPGFEVWENESYIVLGEEDLSYTIDFCNGYDPNDWEAIITLALYDIDSDMAFPNSVLQVEEGCNMTFTAPITTFYLITITGAGNCGGPENQTDNGELTFTCNNAGDCPCQTVFQDKGNGGNGNYANNEADNIYVFCPDGPDEAVQAEFILFDVEAGGPTGCYDHLEVFDGPDTASPQIGGLYCGTMVSDAPGGGGTIVSTDPSGCLTFVFNSDGSLTRPGWVANIDCVLAPIPVELIDFQASAKDDYIQLEWSTASEINNEGFEIWRREELGSWEMIGWQNSKGTGAERQDYRFADSEVKFGTEYFYQLHQKDIDGRTRLSKITSALLNVGGAASFRIYPNPVTHHTLYIEKPDHLSDNIELKLFDVMGRSVNNIEWPDQKQKLQLNFNVESGIYFLQISDQQEKLLLVEKLIKY